MGGLQLAGKTEQILVANRRTASDPHVKRAIYITLPKPALYHSTVIHVVEYT